MKAAVFLGAGKTVAIETVATPRPGPGDVVVTVRRCGICGSDVSMTGDTPYSFKPGPIGHEFSGEVVEIGRDVTTLKIGDRVCCLPNTPCGLCNGCRTGNTVFCLMPKQSLGWNGGFSEYAVVPAGGAIPLPQSLSFADGALVEPMACGLHALRMAGMRGDERILVLGAGTMALSTIYWARRMGAARIVVASRSVRRRDIAREFGADVFHSFSEDDPTALLHDLGGAPDIVVECVGKAGMLNAAIGHVRTQGTVISLGMCMSNEPVLPISCSFKEARLLFPLAYSVQEFIQAARAFDSEQFRPSQMVSDVIPLDALPETLSALREGTFQALKIHVDPTMGSQS